MKRIIQFFDHYSLSLLSGLLLLFIPLYPKIPLFEVIPGYIVRFRLEDGLILFVFFIYIIQVIRKKAVFWQTPLTKPILIYIVIGFISVLSAIFITHTVPMQSLHIQKLVLHYLRRWEYFSLFFIFFTSIKSLRQVKLYFILFLIAVIGVTLYGFGQKYLYWPAFSTMNREFAKGWMLYLTEHARVLSTFGGHYDLAAFTMVSLAFLWSLFFGLKSRIQKIGIFLVLASSFWLIILTASRVSFIAYIASLSIVILLWTFRKGIRWGITRWIVTVSLSIIVMLSFGDLSDRFMRIFRINERFGGIRTLLLRPAVKPPTEKAIYLENSISAVTSKSDQPPSPIKPGSNGSGKYSSEQENKPADVTNEVPEWESTEITSNGTVRTIQKKRVYSKTALQFDLSTGIRLDALWPLAWKGFTTNPLLGSGYSTLTKMRVTDFTEAESTDNGFLRALGETGFLGLLAFLGIIFTIVFEFFHALSGARDKVFYGIIVGGIASIFGLLVNTSYIDIFEASKIALPFWALSGIILGGIHKEQSEIEKNQQPLRIEINRGKFLESIHKIVKSPYLLLTAIIILSFGLRLHKLFAPIADWHSWRQADTSAVTRNFDRFGINLLYPTYDDLSSVASGRDNPRGLRMVEFPIYNAVVVWVKKLVPELSIDAAGRFTSVLMSSLTLLFLFQLVKNMRGVRSALLASLVFAVLPFNIYYSRVVLPEPTLVMLTTGMLFFFSSWLTFEDNLVLEHKLKKIVLFVLALIFGMLGLLVKPIAAFFFLPILYLCLTHKGIKGMVNLPIILYAVLVFIPLILWRLWISQFPEGIPAYTWLLNGDGIRFKGAFFFWIFADRIGRLILGYWGLPLLLTGILRKLNGKAAWFFHVWLVAIVGYLVVFATGNVRHDYYQTIIIPILAIFVAIGIETLLFNPPESFDKRLSQLLGIISCIFMVMFGWYHIRDFYNINHPEIVAAGQAIKDKTHWKSKVIAPYGGDTAFLYQTERFGWPLIDGSIESMISKGAHYYVSVVNDDLTKDLIRYAKNPDLSHPYKLILEDPRFTIIQLVPDSYLPKD